MDKNKAYEIIGIGEGASDEQKTDAYYKHLRNLSSGFVSTDKDTNEPITKEILEEAFAKVMEKEKVELVLTKKEKTSDFLHYYGVKILIALIALSIITGTVIYKLNQPKYDFTVVYIGASFTSIDAEALSNKIKEKMPDAGSIKVTSIDMGYGTDEVEGVILQKTLTQMLEGKYDIVISDKENFTKYAKEGVFTNLDPYTGELGIKIDEPFKVRTKSSIDTSPVFYGIDESNNKLLSMSQDPNNPDNRIKIISICDVKKEANRKINTDKFLKLISE